MATHTSSNGITANRSTVTDDFSAQKPTSNQEADALLKVQERIFRQAEGANRRQGVNVDVVTGLTNTGKVGPSAQGFGFEGKGGITAGMTSNSGEGVRPVTVKKVDFKDLKTGADYRGPSGDAARESVDEVANNGGPREQMQGQQTQKNYKETGKAFTTFPGNPVDQND